VIALSATREKSDWLFEQEPLVNSSKVTAHQFPMRRLVNIIITHYLSRERRVITTGYFNDVESTYQLTFNNSAEFFSQLSILYQCLLLVMKEHKDPFRFTKRLSE
jgi:hypothetical protein